MPALQVIVLGSGGGPDEDNVTGLLVRSTSTQWAKGSMLAVDAGTHLAAISRILRNSGSKNAVAATGTQQAEEEGTPLPPAHEETPVSPKTRPRRTLSRGAASGRKSRTPAKGKTKQIPSILIPEAESNDPFAGLELPNISPDANAGYITRELVSTYLITHPHLDHISGFVINTASFQQTSRPKRLAALPATIDAIKTHIFNNLIWPNLSDEDGGVGLVSFMRLAEGGNIALGDGPGRGYIEVCEGLGVKGWAISHGPPVKSQAHRSEPSEPSMSAPGSTTPGLTEHEKAHRHHHQDHDVVDSTAYFIRDHESGQEVLMFGDVEPDKLSRCPRTARVWEDAAPKIVAGLLGGIFIECSYDDSTGDDVLFGHLCPRHLINELHNLATKVRVEASSAMRKLSSGTDEPEDLAAAASALVGSARKRKRQESRDKGKQLTPKPPPKHYRSRSAGTRKSSSDIPNIDLNDTFMSDQSPTEHIRPAPPDTRKNSQPSLTANVPSQELQDRLDRPLHGVKVVVIHTKNSLKDGQPTSARILEELQAHNIDSGLGCEFILPVSGSSILL